MPIKRSPAAVFFGAHSCHDAHPAVPLFPPDSRHTLSEGRVCLDVRSKGKDVQMRYYVETIHEGGETEAPGPSARTNNEVNAYKGASGSMRAHTFYLVAEEARCRSFGVS